MSCFKFTSDWLRKVVAIVALAGTSGWAHSSVVTFSNFADGNANPLLYNVGTTAPDPADGNKLIIGLSDFFADGSSAATSSATDTLTMTIDAPTGYAITYVRYTEGGTATTTQGTVFATGSMVVGSTPINFLTQQLGFDSNSPWEIIADLAVSNLATLNLSITNNLFAVPAAIGAVARIDKSSAILTVGLEAQQAVPEPTTLALMGLGLAGIGYRRKQLKHA